MPRTIFGALSIAAKPRKLLVRQIEAYYATLKEFEFQRALHEGAVSVAFQTLLGDTARSHGWTLIPQLSDKKSGSGIRPDGTLKDQMNLVRGHWEAKDTSDNLDVEIIKKSKKGYPLNNIIFEDTRNAVLLQNKAEVMRVDLKDPAQVVRLLDQFFGYIEPQIENFEQAVDEFKTRVPELAKALKEKVIDAHLGNKPFKEAFARFFELCKTSLNPNIAKDAVDDMLVQHLLTERLIREIFDNPEFTRRNAIAVEIEKVIAALTSKAFNRDVFLKSLDRFYIAIENAARTITDWSDKQHFLNTIYERFFQGYSVKLADTMGIVYTPQPIVDFMCASVAEVLEKEFGKTLGSPDVNILDPCTGTGNFIVNLMRRMSKRDLPRVYKSQLFANEIMLLPYYIAAMNIEHAYYELTGNYETFEGICFVDTLDLVESHAPQFSFMTQRNTERVERELKAPITVIIGNPPYNVGQNVHNEQNQNRSYPEIDQRIKMTYGKDSAATSVSKLSDAYVKFFRWTSDRLGKRDGIVCFVSNNAFVSQFAFDGMRKHLQHDFAKIFHLDLEGSVRENPSLSGTQYNVFGIQVGVGITIAVMKHRSGKHSINYASVEKTLRREQKLSLVSSMGSAANVHWKRLIPDEKHTWLVPANGSAFRKLIPIASKKARASKDNEVETIFRDYSLGIATHRDSVVYDFLREPLEVRVKQVIDAYNSELDRYRRAGNVANLDTFVRYDKIAWDRDLKNDLRRGRAAVFDQSKIRSASYRPFTKCYLFFDSVLNAEIYGFGSIAPLAASDENTSIACSDLAHRSQTFSSLAVRGIADLHLCATLDGHQCFPFYIYDEDGTNRRENITDWALEQFRMHYKDPVISKWSIFDYVYGILHHPGYRAKFADNLKRELPRIPFAPDFRAFQKAGQELIRLHLDYEKLDPWKLKWIESPGVPLSYRVQKMKLSKDKTTLTVNDSLTLGEIPPEVSEYRLGNRSALDWVIDQYQVYEDPRSKIKSDPNREDDPEYIVRLVGQVVRVSVDTVKIVKGLPEEFADGAAASK